MVRKILLGCGIASSVLYIAGDVLAALRYPGYRYADDTLSELMAAGAPTRALLVALFIPYNLLVMAFAVGVWLSVGPRRAGRVIGTLLVAYGVVGIAGLLLFRMDTRAALAAGQGDAGNAMHPIVTAVISLLLLGIMILAATLLGRRFRWYTYGTILVLIVFGVLTSLQTGRMVANEPTPGMGIEERVTIYATMLWMTVLAMALLRAHGERRRERRTEGITGGQVETAPRTLHRPTGSAAGR